MEAKHLTINSERLKPYRRYNVIVQAKMCPDNLYEGPWSEWSPATEWRTQGDETEGIKSPHFNHFCHLGPVGEILWGILKFSYDFNAVSLSLPKIYLHIENYIYMLCSARKQH